MIGDIGKQRCPQISQEINSEFSLSSQRQLSGNIIVHICGLGASVGYERQSEYSTRRDESHKYGLLYSLRASPLPATNQKPQLFVGVATNRHICFEESTIMILKSYCGGKVLCITEVITSRMPYSACFFLKRDFPD